MNIFSCLAVWHITNSLLGGITELSREAQIKVNRRKWSITHWWQYEQTVHTFASSAIDATVIYVSLKFSNVWTEWQNYILSEKICHYRHCILLNNFRVYIHKFPFCNFMEDVTHSEQLVVKQIQRELTAKIFLPGNAGLFVHKLGTMHRISYKTIITNQKFISHQSVHLNTKPSTNLSSSYVSPRSGLNGLLSRSQFDAVADTAKAITSCNTITILTIITITDFAELLRHCSVVQAGLKRRAKKWHVENYTHNIIKLHVLTACYFSTQKLFG